MSNLLSFISSFGSSAELRSLSPEQLRDRMQQQGLTQQEINVVLSGDRNAVATMVKTSGDIRCCVVPPEPEKRQAGQNDASDFGRRQSVA